MMMLHECSQRVYRETGPIVYIATTKTNKMNREGSELVFPLEHVILILSLTHVIYVDSRLMRGLCCNLR